jgi:hypothetical protein
VQIINNLVLNVIVKGQRPLSLVEDEAFRELLAYLEPGYALPGRKHFTGAVEAKYAIVREKLSSMLGEVEYISATADTWTSIATESFLTVTVHYVSQEWVLKSHVLGTLMLEERHTGEHLSSWIVEMLSKFNVSPSKLVAVVHDNASNMVSAMNVLKSTYGTESVRCTAHTLQLAVNSTLYKDATVKSTLTCARKLVEHFNRSSVAHSALIRQQEQMNLKPLNLIQDVPTRWSSSFHMCERLVNLRLPVTMVMTNQVIIEKSIRQKLELSSEQRVVLETIRELLEPFAVLTKYLEAQSYVSVSAVQPLIKGILGAMNVTDEDTNYATSFKETAVEELLSRFESLFSPLSDDLSAIPVPLRAAALDIRFHKLRSFAARQARPIRQSIENELATHVSTPVEQESDQSSTQTVAKQSTVSDVSNLLSYLQVWITV